MRDTCHVTDRDRNVTNNPPFRGLSRGMLGRGRGRERRAEKDGAGTMEPELKRFIDAVVVPALLERFLREHEGAQTPTIRPAA